MGGERRAGREGCGEAKREGRGEAKREGRGGAKREGRGGAKREGCGEAKREGCGEAKREGCGEAKWEGNGERGANQAGSTPNPRLRRVDRPEAYRTYLIATVARYVENASGSATLPFSTRARMFWLPGATWNGPCTLTCQTPTKPGASPEY